MIGRDERLNASRLEIFVELDGLSGTGGVDPFDEASYAPSLREEDRLMIGDRCRSTSAIA